MKNSLCRCEEPVSGKTFSICERCGMPLIIKRTLPDGTVQLEGRKMGGKEGEPVDIDWVKRP